MSYQIQLFFRIVSVGASGLLDFEHDWPYYAMAIAGGVLGAGLGQRLKDCVSRGYMQVALLLLLFAAGVSLLAAKLPETS